MDLICNYRDRTELRKSFDELAKETFHLSFEDWYQNGYWQEGYNPYSFVENGRIIANVSVNRTDFICEGKKKRLIQLGTVMTAREYRGRGLIRRIMEQIEAEYAPKADGIYLFANDSVLDFYPKFGFRKQTECEYYRPVHTQSKRRVQPVPMQGKRDWTVLERAIAGSVPQGGFEMTGNPQLILFYVTKFMRDSVYFDPLTESYVIAEEENGTLLFYSIFADRPVDPAVVAEGFGAGIHMLKLGFTPLNAGGYTVREHKEEDTTLFVKGDGWETFADQKAMFPLLSHA